MKDDILNKNFEIIQSEMKQLKDLVEEMDNDINMLMQRLDYYEGKTEDYVRKLDDYLTEDQRKRIRK